MSGGFPKGEVDVVWEDVMFNLPDKDDGVPFPPSLQGVQREASEAIPVAEITKALYLSSERSLDCFDLNDVTLQVGRPERTAVFEMRTDKGFVEEHHRANIPGDKGSQDPASHAVGLSCFRGDVSSPGEVGVDVDTQVFDVVRPLERLA